MLSRGAPSAPTPGHPIFVCTEAPTLAGLGGSGGNRAADSASWPWPDSFSLRESVLYNAEAVPTRQVLQRFSNRNLSISVQATVFCDENLTDKTNVVYKVIWVRVAWVLRHVFKSICHTEPAAVLRCRLLAAAEASAAAKERAQSTPVAPRPAPLRMGCAGGWAYGAPEVTDKLPLGIFSGLQCGTAFV